VEAWFGKNRRELPWRRVGPDGRRDPYHALVAETMAQQTQISRVVERFGVFVERFPKVEALAAADEADVLALWSGLGYYRRARNLHAAARVVAAAGGFPPTAAEWTALPGVGRYTAGAVASIVLGERAAMVDGNVTRVLARVEMPDSATDASDAGRAMRERWAWGRSAVLVGASGDPGAFNEGMMELGATVCLPSPRTPVCERCPLANLCKARAAGVQMAVPPAKRAPARRVVWADALVVRDGAGRVLVERRGGRGMWAGLWQAPTIESDHGPASGAALAREVGVGRARRVGGFEHGTSHRAVRFGVWVARPLTGREPKRGEWRTLDEVRGLGMSSAQARVLEIALGADGGGCDARAGRAGGMLTA
jgi:A/G-specific adenine glycosylase